VVVDDDEVREKVAYLRAAVQPLMATDASTPFSASFSFRYSRSSGDSSMIKLVSYGLPGISTARWADVQYTMRMLRSEEGLCPRKRSCFWRTGSRKWRR
jgi:hypothetical protein